MDAQKEIVNKAKSTMREFWKKLRVVLLIVLLVGIAAGSYFVFGSYSSGYRAGNVMKISKKGIIFKTWEGQLNVGGFQDGGANGDMATTVWEFSVLNKQVLSDIEKAVDSGHKVKLHYEEKFFQLDILGDTKYFVTKVEEVKE